MIKQERQLLWCGSADSFLFPVPCLQGLQDSAPQHIPPDKVGWIRKFCGKGIFREVWKNRFMVLRADQLFVCEKEVSRRGQGLQMIDYRLLSSIRSDAMATTPICVFLWCHGCPISSLRNWSGTGLYRTLKHVPVSFPPQRSPCQWVPCVGLMEAV